jgi:ketosteroid isomerase-like protein
MSQENVEIVRRALELNLEPVRRGDPGAAFDQVVREGLIDSDVEWRAGKEGAWPPATPLADSVGRDGYLALVRTWTETFDDLVLEAEEIIDADNDRVVVIVHASGTGKASRALVDARYGAVYTLEGGRIVRLDFFPRPDQALEAVGLRE